MWSPVGPLGMNGVIDCNRAPTAEAQRLQQDAWGDLPVLRSRPRPAWSDTILAVFTAVRTDRLVRHGEMPMSGAQPVAVARLLSGDGRTECLLNMIHFNQVFFAKRAHFRERSAVEDR
jgi:hypothetical protein